MMTVTVMLGEGLQVVGDLLSQIKAAKNKKISLVVICKSHKKPKPKMNVSY